MNIAPSVIKNLDGSSARGMIASLLQKQRITTTKTAGDFAVFRSPHQRRPRISAEEAMPSADNLRQKQLKQRKPPPGGCAA
jgi:hypothetical protein